MKTGDGIKFEKSKIRRIDLRHKMLSVQAAVFVVVCRLKNQLITKTLRNNGGFPNMRLPHDE